MALAEKNNIKQIALIIIIMSSTITFTGCWSSEEIPNQAIVVGTGIDLDEDGQIKIAVQVVQPIKVGKKEDVPFIVLTSKGETAFEAIRNFTLVIGRELLWTHLQLIIIGPNLAKKDLIPFLDYFFREHHARLKPAIFFTDEPIEEILKLPSPFEPISAFRIRLQIKESEKIQSFTPYVRFYEFFKMLLATDGVGYVPIIKKTVNEGYPLISTKGISVFKDGRNVGILNKKEARGVLWVQNKVKGGVIVVPQKNQDKEDTDKISLEILGSSAAIKPVLKGDNLSVTFEIESTMNINEIIDSFIITKSSIEDLEKRTEEEIKKEIKASLKKTQKWKTDIYGIDETVHRNYTGYWNKNKDQWDTIFPELDIKIDVKVNLINTGFLKNTLE